MLLWSDSCVFICCVTWVVLRNICSSTVGGHQLPPVKEDNNQKKKLHKLCDASISKPQIACYVA